MELLPGRALRYARRPARAAPGRLVGLRPRALRLGLWGGAARARGWQRGASRAALNVSLLIIKQYISDGESRFGPFPSLTALDVLHLRVKYLMFYVNA